MKKFLLKKRGSGLNKEILNLPFALKEIPCNTNELEYINNNNTDINNTVSSNNNEKNEVKELKIKQLKSFNKIDLCNTNLIKIYPHIGFLHNTTSLKLCCNKLTEIPPEIGYMKNLKILNLSYNQIVEIPDTICYLNGLIDLDISNNRIKEIPVFIRKLINLISLNLQGNEIEIIPSEIGELKNIVNLYLSDNPIRYLPIELNKIDNLTELGIENCPLAISFDECRPAFTLSTEMKDLIVSRNQKLLLESSKYQNNHTLDMINELEQYKKYYSNTPSLSLTCDQNIFDVSHCHFFNDILLNKNLRVNLSSTTLNQEIETETLSLDEDNDDSSSTIEEPINTDYKVELKIPSLKELAARTIVRNRLLMPTHLLQDDLLYYLSSYKTCSFCHGPYFDLYIRRVRVMYKDNKDIPFEYRLCRAHFNTNEERIKEMFKVRPITAPKSLNSLDLHQDKKYKFKDNDVGSNDSSTYSLNNSVVPNTLSSNPSLNDITSKTNKPSFSSSPSNDSNVSHKNGVKHIFNFKSKYHNRKHLKDINYTINNNAIISNDKEYFQRDILTDEPSALLTKSVTVNELLNMNQPSLPSLSYPTQINSIKNI